MSLECTSASKVTFAYNDEKCNEQFVIVYVPADWLWSGEGLSEMFDVCRIAFMGDESSNPSEAWESWHISECTESIDGFVLRDRTE